MPSSKGALISSKQKFVFTLSLKSIYWGSNSLRSQLLDSKTHMEKSVKEKSNDDWEKQKPLNASSQESNLNHVHLQSPSSLPLLAAFLGMLLPPVDHWNPMKPLKKMCFESNMRARNCPSQSAWREPNQIHIWRHPDVSSSYLKPSFSTKVSAWAFHKITIRGVLITHFTGSNQQDAFRHAHKQQHEQILEKLWHPTWFRISWKLSPQERRNAH